MVRASLASERARRGHKRASALGERAVPKNYPSERLNIVNNVYLLPKWLATTIDLCLPEANHLCLITRGSSWALKAKSQIVTASIASIIGTARGAIQASCRPEIFKFSILIFLTLRVN